MKKLCYLISFVGIIGICSCENSNQKVIDKYEKISNEYIERVSNAQSKEEVDFLHNQRIEKVKALDNSVTDDEKKRLKRERTWEEQQRIDKINKSVEQAEFDAWRKNR